MGIKSLGSGRYEVRAEAGYDAATGKRIQRKAIVTGSRDDAKQALALLSTNSGRVVHRASAITVGSYLCDMWLPTLTHLAPYTQYDYRTHCENHVRPAIGAVKLTALRAPHIEGMLRAMKPGQAWSVYRTLRAALNQAVKWDLIDRNPCDRVTPPRKVAASSSKAASYSMEQVAEIALAIRGEWFEPLWLVCAFGGLRPEEACGLNSVSPKWGGVLDVAEVYSNTGKGWMLREPKTASSVRSVTLTGYPAERLSELCRNRIGALAVTPRKGTRANGADFSRAYKAFCVERGLPHLPPKNLRHTAATQMLATGSDIAVVSKVLGHASVTTTANFYLKPLASAQDLAVKAYADRLGEVFALSATEATDTKTG